MSNEPDRRRAPLAEGDVIILYDRRRRRYRVTLAPGALFETHLGYVPHDELIGRTEGFTVLTNKRHRMLVLRPTFAEGVLDLPRQSQVIYPKDLGAILMHADLYPGAHVVEVGLGSGAAAAAVLRAIGPAGALTSYEVREEIVAPARRNVAELAPGAENHTIVVADAYDGIAGRGIDRVLVDIPEPWRLLDGLAETLRMGGIVLSYLPTVLQVHQLALALNLDTRWRLVQTVELWERPWHVTDKSVRPEHRMVAHTGFITTARRCEPLPAAKQPVEPVAEDGERSAP